MRLQGVSLPCTALQKDLGALRQACQRVLSSKAAALIAAGKRQIIERKPVLFKPTADPLSPDCFQLAP